jgi:hypothetical protein
MDRRECGGENDVNHGFNPVGMSVKLSSCWSSSNDSRGKLVYR